MNAYHLVNVGPVPVPAACACITAPFTVPAFRHGDGEASGPAGAQPLPAPGILQRQLQASRDAEDRATLPATVQDGLAGNGNASMWVAYLLTAGTAVQRDEKQTAKWLLQAARQGQAGAAIQLGYRYHRGLGVEQSDQAAAYWFHSSAVTGDPNGMIALGLLYAAGRGVEQDWSAAVGWFEQANAMAPHPLATRFLADAYVCGVGVRQDHERAATLYRAAAPHDVSSRVQLGHMHARKCTRDGDEAAFSAYESAAHEGDAEAQIALSHLYRDGTGVQQDTYNAYMWARLAEFRTPPGDLHAEAAASAAAAARMLPAFLITDADMFARAIIDSARR